MRLLVQFLESLQPGDIGIINMPPRHGKSETVRAFAEYYLGQHPNHEIMYTSYSAALANKSSRQIRNEVQTGLAFSVSFPEVVLSSDAKAVQQWNTTEGGGLRAAGVGGSITGMGAHLAIVDDPIKGRRQSESALVREATKEWLRSDLLTRLAPNAIMLLIQTRWHVDDPAGYVMQQAGLEESDFGGLRVRQLSLPAIAEPTLEQPDPLGRDTGDALWPTRWPAEKLLKAARVLGEYDWASLYQQRPFTKGGSVFRDNPVRYQSLETSGRRITAYMDTAASKATSADYSALVVLASWVEGDRLTGDVAEVIRGKYDLLQLAAVVADVNERWGVTVQIEETGQSSPIFRYLKEQKLRILGRKPVGDKFTRAQPVAAAWNRGDLRLPVAAPWLGDFITEITAFTGTGSDLHDDQVDALAGAWAAARNISSWDVAWERVG